MLTTQTHDPVVSIADAMRHGDPDGIADALRAEGVVLSGPITFLRTIEAALDELPRLLEQESVDEAARAHSVALLAASLSPAVRAEYPASLRAVASLIPGDVLDELHNSPSPHARAGASLLSELLAAHPDPVGEEPPPAQIPAPPAHVPAAPDDAPIVAPDVALQATEADVDENDTSIDAILRRRPVESIALLWTSLPTRSGSEQVEILGHLRRIDEAALAVLARFGVRAADAERRVVALTALGDLAAESDRPLLTAAGDPSPDVRLAALRALERRGGSGGLDAAAGRVLDPRPDVREAAVAVLQITADVRAVPHLMTAAADPVESVQRRARDAIASMASMEVIDLITPALRSPETEDVAFDLLVEIGEAATESVIGAIDGADQRVRDRIGEILRITGGARRVRALLSDPDPVRRRRAVEAVAAIGGREATHTLLGMLQDPERDIRLCAVELLAQRQDPTIADELALMSLSEPDPFVRAAINEAIGELTHASRGASRPEEPNG